MAAPGETPDFLAKAFGEGDGERQVLDVDKAWAGIHYLLTGETWGGEPPLNFIVLGGVPIGDVDVGYGPARAIRAAELQRVADALVPITAETLRQRFDPKKMAEEGVYPQIWDEGEEAFDYCEFGFERLKEYVTKAAGKGEGMVVWLS